MTNKKTARGPKVKLKYQKYYFILFSVILLGVVVTAVLQFWPHAIDSDNQTNSYYISDWNSLPEVRILESAPLSPKGDTDCNYYTCFDVYRCSYETNRISLYVYPMKKYLHESGQPILQQISREYYDILTAISESEFFTSDPDKACIFVPPLDLLNQNTLKEEKVGQILAQLPRWNGGSNHLLFNMLPGTAPDFNTVLQVPFGKAMIAGGGFSSWTYRPGYDVSIPVYNPALTDLDLPDQPDNYERPYLAISAQVGIHKEYRDQLNALSSKHKTILVLDRCEISHEGDSPPSDHLCVGTDQKQYPHILKDARFCIVLRRARLGQQALMDSLFSGCIPVVLIDGYVLPFSDVLDWRRAAVLVREQDLLALPNILEKISPARAHEMRRQGQFFWNKYFKSMKEITLTTLQVINDRVFPYTAKDEAWWNEPIPRKGATNPLFLPLIPPKSHGFTAVVLTYDREESLFAVIKQIAQTPSLSKVLVVWNNQEKSPPSVEHWPKISKPLKVVQTKENKLSNRFFPYDEIETECILAIDDDIVMVTPDELEFGYEVWQEFPDRLVGYPGRLHLWDHETAKWKYESEWTNDISMVLTGVAFYHKYFSYLYTHKMSRHIRDWVDDHMNCEDIAMNFLVTNYTGKPPIKVAPRKKFKCPECTNDEMISANMEHMVERSECIAEFEKSYGMMPLKTAVFRADPVLFKDNVPKELKRFHDIGSL
ncbi:exostosin-2-like [Apostichopus japonicus]|uniref:exostosin-2-like n=1 Tax=Stichopus japonicus TaxID=307972 RepID=UPI003AB6FC9B